MTDAHAPTPEPRKTAQIEGNYLQAAMQFCVNINTIIWQRLAAIMLFQVGSLAFSVQNSGTITAIAAILLMYILSCFLLYATHSDQRVRTELLEQMNFIASVSMRGFYSDNKVKLEKEDLSAPFQLYDFKYDSHHRWVRDKGGVTMLFVGLSVLDFWAIIFYGIQPKHFLENFHLFGLPLVK